MQEIFHRINDYGDLIQFTHNNHNYCVVSYSVLSATFVTRLRHLIQSPNANIIIYISLSF